MANVVRWSVEWSSAGQVIVCTGHLQASDSTDPADAATLAEVTEAIADWWDLDYGALAAAKTNYCPQLTATRATAQRILPTESGVHEQLLDGVGGTLLDDLVPLPPPGTIYMPEPPQCAWLVGLRTGTDSRNLRGRLFFPATFAVAEGSGTIDKDSRAAGLIPPDWRQRIAYQAAHLATRFRDVGGVGSAAWVLAVYSRVLGQALAVTHFEVNTTIRTQRRRQAADGREAYGLNGDP